MKTKLVTQHDIKSGTAYPNEPAGYTRIMENSFSTLQTSTGAWSADIAGTMTTDSGGGNMAKTSDSGAPQSAPDVFRTTWASGLAGGNAPCSLMGWDNSYEHGTEMKELYFSMWIKIAGNGSTFQAYGGVNKFGFFGYGVAPGNVANQGFFDLWPDTTGAGPQQVTHLNLHWQQQAPWAQVELGTGYTIDCGAGASWHHWETVYKLNTVGSANGVLQWWQDGTLIMNRTTHTWIDSSDSHGFFHWKWQPYFGGVGYSKSQTDYAYIDHVYISGVAK